MQLPRQGLMVVLTLLAVSSLLTAATITYTFDGTLGPILAGTDPLGANGQTGTVTANVNTTLTPTSHTSTTATYTLPAGTVTVVIGGSPYPTTGTSTLKYTFPASGPTTVLITSKVNVNGLNGTATMTASLAHGSITNAVTRHPTKFRPSPQTLKAATQSGGPGSQVKYTVPIFGTTVVGLAGTASN